MLCYTLCMPAVHATHQQRGYVTRSKRERLESVLAQCAVLYNAALQERRDAWRMAGKSVTYIDQCKSLVHVRSDMQEWGDLDTQIGRGVLRRVDRAFTAFFRRVKRGENPGHPRFKPSSRFRTLEIAEPRPGMVKVRPDGRKAYVRVKGLPVIEMRLKRSLPPSTALKSLRLVVRPNGLAVDLGYQVEKEPLASTGKQVGIDLGVNNRLALSDGRMVEAREADRSREKALQRAVSRGRKGSNRRRKRARMLAKERHRNRVRNRNAVHRLTAEIVRRYDGIAMERLVIRNMTRSARGTIEEPGVNVRGKSGLNREILNQTWGLIREQLRYKAEWAGREFVEVDPRFTSKICHACGNRTPQGEYRTYRCGVCGQEEDRDTNAAINVLQRAFGPTGAGISPESLQEVGMIA